MERVRLRFARGVVVEFVDRELGIKRVEEWAARGTRFVQLVYGPEGCGKTAWLKQSAVLLRSWGYDVIYVNTLQRDYVAYIDLKEAVRRLAEAAAERSGVAEVKLADLAIQLAKYALKRRRKRIAVLADDVFKAIGLSNAAGYVMWMLSIIEYPPGDYESVVAVVATNEGISRRELGKHRWADLRIMWNMPREGFKQLYELLPGEEPPFEEAWRLTGGNPSVLAKLYEEDWDVSKVVEEVVVKGDFNFLQTWRSWLEEAVEDPDILWREDAPRELVERLIEWNFIVFNLPKREPWLWVDAPPPESDGEIGVGRHVAWQTPLHREAVRRAIDVV
ncbi:ATP-binding protein [Pyrobaculum sp.]|uniref:ATP-binding protein n=1 Tax=Pyrobaculum sp. TaxID=2004705 RepID=UPI003173FE29